MGLLEDANDLINRSVASAGRSTKAIALKAQIAELDKRGADLYAMLGRAGFDALRADDAFYGSQGALFDAIENHERQRAALAAGLERVKALGEMADGSSMPTSNLCIGSMGGVGAACNMPNLTAQGDMVACPQCSGANKQSASFCIHCGMRLSDDSGNNANPAPTCSRCGAEVRDGALFCVACGAALGGGVIEKAEVSSGAHCDADQKADEAKTEDSSLRAQTECGRCGFPNNPDASFCRRCGEQLK